MYTIGCQFIANLPNSLLLLSKYILTAFFSIITSHHLHVWYSRYIRLLDPPGNFKMLSAIFHQIIMDHAHGWHSVGSCEQKCVFGRQAFVDIEANSIFDYSKFVFDSIHPWGQNGAHLGPTGPRWAPCWPREPCHLGNKAIICKIHIYSSLIHCYCKATLLRKCIFFVKSVGYDMSTLVYIIRLCCQPASHHLN